MSMGDSIPRYTYTMDFDPMDEQSPLTDFWQMNDGLDTEDAAVIASLATQVLQSKLNYEYEDSIGMNGQAEVANYTESRSSPQSQYSAIAQEEPAESFRGLMEDHDRGAQFSGEDATSEYDLEPAARGRVSDSVAEIEEPAGFLRESNPTDSIYSLLNVSAEMDEMRGARTASQIVNEVLRNSQAAAAAAQSYIDVDIQALQSQAAQLTPPDSESPSVSADERDYGDMEEDFLTGVIEQHDDCEPDKVISEEETSLDTEAQQQLMAESNKLSTTDEGRQPSPARCAPRKVGRPRKSDAAVEPPDLVSKELGITEMAIHEDAVLEGDDVVEPAVVDGAEINRAEETPAARSRGRPRKSEITELTPASSTKRGPGRPPKLVAPEATNESAPAAGKRGRPRKSEVEEQLQVHTKESDISIEEAPVATPATSKRGRPRRSDVEDKSQVHAKESDVPAEEAPATPAAGKRGRPRKSDVEDKSQVHAKESDIPAEEAPAIPVAGKRGRPRRSTMVDEVQAPTSESQPFAVETSTSTPSLGKRGRPRKSEVVNTTHGPTDEHTLSATEAANSTPAPSRRGRPRKSEVISITQNLTSEHALSAAEIATSTPAPSRRGRPRKSDVVQASTDEPQPPIVETPTVAPASGKRGRPRKSDAASAIIPETPAMPEVQAEPEISTEDIASPATEAMEQQNQLSRQDDATEKQHTSTPTAPAQKRGRGRPPKNEVLVNTTADTETAANDEEAEPQGSKSEHMEDVAKDAAVDGNSGTAPVQEDKEATPARKRGRPRSSAADMPSLMIPAPVTALAKKRGRPPKTATTEDSTEKLEEPSQPEAQEIEEPITKRRRTDSDIIMEDPPKESQPEAREERPASARERRVTFAADTTAPKQLVPIKFMRRNSDSTGLKPGFISINIQRFPQLGGQTNSSRETAGADIPKKSTATQQTELFISGLPRPTAEKKFEKRPKTYGRRFKK